MIEEMDKNNIKKTALIPPLNETMYEKESTFQDNLHRFFRLLIMNFPKVGFRIYDGLVKDSYFKVNGSFKIFTEPNNDIVANAIKCYPKNPGLTPSSLTLHRTEGQTPLSVGADYFVIKREDCIEYTCSACEWGFES